jgi:hypothetical protein
MAKSGDIMGIRKWVEKSRKNGDLKLADFTDRLYKLSKDIKLSEINEFLSLFINGGKNGSNG